MRSAVASNDKCYLQICEKELDEERPQSVTSSGCDSTLDALEDLLSSTVPRLDL